MLSKLNGPGRPSWHRCVGERQMEPVGMGPWVKIVFKSTLEKLWLLMVWMVWMVLTTTTTTQILSARWTRKFWSTSMWYASWGYWFSWHLGSATEVGSSLWTFSVTPWLRWCGRSREKGSKSNWRLCGDGHCVMVFCLTLISRNIIRGGKTLETNRPSDMVIIGDQPAELANWCNFMYCKF